MARPALKNDGERMIPEFHKGRNIYGAHVGRYQAGLSVIEDKVVLDIACGSGYGTKLMASKAKKVYGVDVDEATVNYAKEHYSANNITYLVGSGTEIPLENKSVDIVVSYETIEHIEDYTQFMKEVKRVLRPKGLFLLSTPNDTEYMEGNHFHVHEFEYDELKALVKQFFRYRKDYFQTLWLYSSILPKELQTSEWQQPIDTTSTVSLNPDQCIYFFMLCSDSDIREDILPLGVIGEHFRQRTLQEESRKRQQRIGEFEKRQSELKEENRRLKELYDNAVHSESFRLGRAILFPVIFINRVVQKLRSNQG